MKKNKTIVVPESHIKNIPTELRNKPTPYDVISLFYDDEIWDYFVRVINLLLKILLRWKKTH